MTRYSSSNFDFSIKLLDIKLKSIEKLDGVIIRLFDFYIHIRKKRTQIFEFRNVNKLNVFSKVHNVSIQKGSKYRIQQFAFIIGKDA